MKITTRRISFFIVFIVFSSCTTSAYITDEQSIERQKEMRRYRTGLNFSEAGILFASAIGEAFTGVSVYSEPSHSFRKMVLVNAAKDTLFVNMVTDWIWKDSIYCDIRDIVLPPLLSAKVVVPIGAAYNIFFRTDFNAPDDEKIEINTSQVARVKLKPGMGKSDITTNN
jgi:hypothetical protein